MEDNIKQVVKDVRFLIATNCNDETLQKRIENYIKELSASPPSMPDDYAIYKEQQKLPYTKHLDDGQFNDGQQSGFEIGAKWMRSECDGLIKQKAVEFEKWKLKFGWLGMCDAQSGVYYRNIDTDEIKTTEELYEIFNPQER